MSRVRRLLYSAVALVAAAFLAGGMTVVASAETTDDIIVVQFYAESEDDDDCPIGFTEGTLSWHPGSRIVEVRMNTSTQLVEPLPECPVVPSYATTFSAYARGAIVASTTQASGGAFRFTTFRPIDVIVVQVCRNAVPYDHCGQPTPFSGNS